MKSMLAAILGAASAFAQTPPPPVFEVASIKPADPHASGVPFDVTIAGGLSATRISVSILIQMAYKVKPFLIYGAPRWIDSEEFAIVAKPPAGTPPVNPPKITDDFLLRVQALLAERFHLAVHHEKREMSVYLLEVAKNGPTLKTAEPQQKFRLKTNTNGRILNEGGAKIGLLVTLLANRFDHPVLDETGLTGSYSFDLKWTPDPPAGAPGQPQTANTADSGGPSLFTALQEQLGLKLESKRRPVEVIVIDHVERPTEN